MPDSGKFKDLYLNSAHTYPCQLSGGADRGMYGVKAKGKTSRRAYDRSTKYVAAGHPAVAGHGYRLPPFNGLALSSGGGVMRLGGGAVLPARGHGLRRQRGPSAHLQGWRWAAPWPGRRTPTPRQPSGRSGLGQRCSPANCRPEVPRCLWEHTPHLPAAPRLVEPPVFLDANRCVVVPLRPCVLLPGAGRGDF